MEWSDSRPPLLAPAVGVAHPNHRAENVVPGLLVLHHRVREHAAVPADVAHGPGQVARVVAEPVAGVLDDIELAVRVPDLAVAAGLRMVAGAEHRAVILGDV